MARPQRKHVALTGALVAALTIGAVGARNVANEPSGPDTVRGKLLVSVAMPVGPDSVSVTVQADDGTVTPVDVNASQADQVAALAGQDVKVTGDETDGTIDADSIEPTTARAPSEAAAPAQMKVAFVLIRPQGNTQIPANPITKATVEAAVFGPTGTNATPVADWFANESAGRTTMIGQVFAAPDGGFLPSGSADNCDLWTAKQQAITAAHLDSSWTNVVAVYPGASCPFAGIAYVGSNGVLLNGYIGQSVIEHELGHNLGVWHAGAMVSLSGTTSQWDYGDSTDTMGSGNQTDYSAWHKWRIGWLPDTNVQTITAQGATTVSVSPLESPVAGIEMVRVGAYEIDRRASVGRDVGLSGVWVRKIGQSGTSDTVIPVMPSGNVKPLLVGQTFVDAAAGVTIKTLADDPASSTATVQVCLGSCAPPPPTTTTVPGPTTTIGPTTTTTIPPGSGIGYEQGDNNDGAGAYASFRVGQTFTVPLAASVSAADFLGFYKGASGLATCRIYATSGGLPTGQPLATAATAQPVGTVKAWQTCNFPTPAALAAGKQYALVVSWSGGNGSNALIWRNDNTSPTYAGGTRIRSRSSGAWDTSSLLQSEDNLFRVR